MRHVRVMLARLRGMFFGQRADDDLREELESHLALETAELMRRGLDPETRLIAARPESAGEAVAQALELELGSPTLYLERLRVAASLEFEYFWGVAVPVR